MRVRPTRHTVLLALLLAVAAPALAQGDRQSRLAEIDRLFTEAYPADGPGAAVILVDNGETVFREAYGMADLELSVPMTPDNVFRLGSITKQFTAVAVMLLVEEGKLELDAPVQRYLPGYPGRPERETPITVRHLLTHTAGIPNYTSDPAYLERMREDLTVAELLDRFDEEPLEFEPGTRWRYSNSGYALLGAVLEAVSGQGYAEFLERRIFRPLGLDDTSYGDPARIVPRRAEGYEGEPGAYENAAYLSMTQPFAAGALVSTVDDLARWDRALVEDELLSPASRQALWTSYQLTGGLPAGYGLGWAVSTCRGQPMIHHGGGIHGFATYAGRFPEEGLYVAVLSNHSGHRPAPGALAHQAAQAWLGLEPPERERVDVPASTLDELEGTYELSPGLLLSVERRDDRLWIQLTGQEAAPVEAVSPRLFVNEPAEADFEFFRDDAGQVSGLVLHQGAQSLPAPRISATPGEIPGTTDENVAAVPPEVLERYVGTYQLFPGFELVVTREGDRLFAQATNQPRFEIFPRSPTRFFYKVVPAEIEFEATGEGPAPALVLFQGGQEVRAERKAAP